MNQTIYIQKTVWSKFQGEPNKSAIVNELLKRHYGMPGGVNMITNKDGTISPRRIGPPASFQTAKVEWEEDPETGYPCCTKAKPCKHWAWDSTDTVWRNSLTGKTKEE